MSASAVNVQLAAIRKLATEAADNGLLAPELAAGIAKVPGARSEGPRAGNWLTRDQASRLLSLPDPETLKGKRDRGILGLLLGCGLRRDELVRLTVENIQQREGRWVIVDILGKGRRRRTVPVPGWVKVWIDDWLAAAGLTESCVFRAIHKGGRVVGDGLTSNIVWSIVRGYPADIGVAKLVQAGSAGERWLCGGKRLIQTDQFLLDCVVNKLGFIVDAQLAHQVELVRLDSFTLRLSEQPFSDDLKL